MKKSFADYNKAFDRLIDEFIEDRLSMSEEEILAEAKEDGINIEEVVAEVQGIFRQAVRQVEQKRKAKEKTMKPVVDALKKLWDKNSPVLLTLVSKQGRVRIVGKFHLVHLHLATDRHLEQGIQLTLKSEGEILLLDNEEEKP